MWCLVGLLKLGKKAVKWPHIKYFTQPNSVQLGYRTTCQFVENTGLQSRSETWSVPHFSEENALKDDWQLAYDIRRRHQKNDPHSRPCCFALHQKVWKDSPQGPDFQGHVQQMKDPWLGETLSQLWPTYWSGGPAVQTKGVLYCPHC